MCKYVMELDSQSEFAPDASSRTDFGTLTQDNLPHTLQLQVAFSSLTGNPIASHINIPTTLRFKLINIAGVATTTPPFVGFTAGVASNAASNTLDRTMAFQ